MASVQEMRDIFGPGHRQIAQITPTLYLSDIGCASDDILAVLQVTHVISILSAPIPWLGPSANSPCKILHVRCDDTNEDDILSHFDSTNAFINEAHREKGKVLVHCLAGVSRSPTIVAAYLIAAGMRRDDALDLLRERRGVVEPNPGFIEQLAIFESRVRSMRGTAGFTTHGSYPHAISCK